jgi:hypothetical protein
MYIMRVRHAGRKRSRSGPPRAALASAALFRYQMGWEGISTRSWLTFIGVAAVLVVMHELELEQMMAVVREGAKPQAAATHTAPDPLELQAEKIKQLERQVASLRQVNSAPSGGSGSPPAASTHVSAPPTVLAAELGGTSTAPSQRQRVLTAPVKCRADFAERANDLGLTHYAAEIGVNNGWFSRYAHATCPSPPSK